MPYFAAAAGRHHFAYKGGIYIERKFVYEIIYEFFYEAVHLGDASRHEPMPQLMHKPLPQPMHEPMPRPMHKPMPRPMHKPMHKPIHKPMPIALAVQGVDTKAGEAYLFVIAEDYNCMPSNKQTDNQTYNGAANRTANRIANQIANRTTNQTANHTNIQTNCQRDNQTNNHTNNQDNISTIASGYCVEKLMEWFYQDFIQLFQRKSSKEKVKKSLFRALYKCHQQLGAFCAEHRLKLGCSMAVLVMWGDNYLLYSTGKIYGGSVSLRGRKLKYQFSLNSDMQGKQNKTKQVGEKLHLLGYGEFGVDASASGRIRKGDFICLLSEGLKMHYQEPILKALMLSGCKKRSLQTLVNKRKKEGALERCSNDDEFTEAVGGIYLWF